MAIDRLTIAALMVLAACGGRGRVSPTDEADALLAESDTLWSASREGRLDGVQGLLERAAVKVPDHPGLSWRRARLAVSRAMASADDIEAAAWLAEARDVGLACAMVRLGSGEAALDLPERDPGDLRRARCAWWAGWAWVRWSVRVGARAAALDAPRVDALLAWDTPGTVEGHDARWRQLVWQAADGRRSAEERDEAVEALEALSRQHPELALVVLADAIALDPAARYRKRALERAEEADPAKEESLASIERMRRAAR